MTMTQRPTGEAQLDDQEIARWKRGQHLHHLNAGTGRCRGQEGLELGQKRESSNVHEPISGANGYSETRSVSGSCCS